MMKNTFTLIIILLLLFTSACGSVESGDETIAPSPAQTSLSVAWKCTTPAAPWRDCASLSLTPGAAGNADIDIDSSDLLQEVVGFGGAFNEKGWVALSVLPPEERDAVIKEMFDPIEGAKYNLCRVPIGASDYAVSRYTLDETAGDYETNDFSIKRDREKLIPYIMAAMAYRPDLKVWGSAWTPPTWMKANGAFDGGNMKDDPETYRAYALYLARFVEAYQAEGIDLFAVAVQNEPMIETHYPSCLWDPAQFGTFIRDYMGPLFEERAVQAAIMLGTIQEGDFWAFPNILSDPDVNQYVSIVGFQWSGVSAVPMTRREFPDKMIYQTETECGNLFWRSGYNPDRPPNDWSYGIYTWDKIKEYFDAGVNAYLLWNMILDEEGKNIDAEQPWPQNAAVTVDRDTGTVTYTPMFYAFKHFTYFVESGARYVTIDKNNAAAFLNPDGTLIIELQNTQMKARTITINIDGNTLTLDIPGMSWNTLSVPPH